MDDDERSTREAMDRSTRRLALTGVIGCCIYLVGLVAAVLLWRLG
jgi:hypothetical protein